MKSQAPVPLKSCCPRARRQSQCQRTWTRSLSWQQVQLHSLNALKKHRGIVRKLLAIETGDVDLRKDGACRNKTNLKHELSRIVYPIMNSTSDGGITVGEMGAVVSGYSDTICLGYDT